MRARLASLLVLGFAAAAAMPASGAILPKCGTRLVRVTAGTSSSCQTQGPQPLGSCCVGVWRTVTVEVAEGAVDATLACDYGTPITVHVAGLDPVRFGRWGGNSCTLTLRATETTTSAAATSTYSYVSYETQH